MKCRLLLVFCLLGYASTAFPAGSPEQGSPEPSESCKNRFDRWGKAGIPMNLLEELADKVAQQPLDAGRHVIIVDMNQPSGKRRLFVIDRLTGDVKAQHTTHGTGNHQDKNYRPTKFSNLEGSRAISLGLFKTSSNLRKTTSRRDRFLEITGLEDSNNRLNHRGVGIQTCRAKKIALAQQAQQQGHLAESLGSLCVDQRFLDESRHQLVDSVGLIGIGKQPPAPSHREPNPRLANFYQCKLEQEAKPQTAYGAP